MGSVLLGVSGSDALVRDTELKPPDVQPSKAVNTGGGKGSPVVTADGVWETMSTKEMKELVLNGFRFDSGESAATEQVTTEVVDDGKRVAVVPVAHAEVTFEIDGPNLVGCGGVEGCGAGMLPTSSSGAGADPAIALEDIEDGASGRPVLVGKSLAESLQDLSSPPSVACVFRQDELDELSGSLMRTRPRGSAVLSKPTGTVLPVTMNPFVAGRAANTVPETKLRHRPVSADEILDKVASFQHRVGLQPGRPSSFPRGSEESVNHVPGHLLGLYPGCTG